MSRNNRGKSPRVDLKLNLPLSTLRGNSSRRLVVDDNVDDMDQGGVSPNNSSSPTSCVSSEAAADSPDATSMVLAACPRCLMYVMLAEEDPKCPKCKSTVILDFLNNNNNESNSNKGNSKKNRKG